MSANFLHRRSPEKAPRLKNVKFLLQYKLFQINLIYENNSYSTNVTKYHDLRFEITESFDIS